MITASTVVSTQKRDVGSITLCSSAMSDSEDDERLAQPARSSRRAQSLAQRPAALVDSDEEELNAKSDFVASHEGVVYGAQDHEFWFVHEHLCKLRAPAAFSEDKTIRGLQVFSRHVPGGKQV